jgi:ferredoxin-nitrate reductase
MAIPTIQTICPYCGVGCGLEIVSAATAQKIRGDRAHPSSQGMICVKGATLLEATQQDRLLYPMMRESLKDPFQRVTWDQALNRIIQKIQAISSPDAFCMYGSGQLLTEDYYVAQKLVKGCLGTNNFDANSRLCMSSAVSGYVKNFGSDGPPCCYEDLDLTDCAFLVGTNTAECHPILYNRLRKRHKSDPNLKLIVVDPRRTVTAEGADLYLGIRPGSDISLFNGIAYLLWQWQAFDESFIAQFTTGGSEYLKYISAYPPEKVADLCHISQTDLEKAALYWKDSQRVLSLWSMGLNQSAEGTAKVSSLINIHLFTGQVGKPGCGPFSLTGQPNAMGGREAGGLAHLLPGYRQVQDPQSRAQVEAFWGLPSGKIAPHRGRPIWDMIRGLEAGSVEVFWIVATNPLVSLPDLNRTKKALLSSPFTIYQEAYYPTETTAYAHLLLPAAQWGEKTGVMTNSERRITLSPAFQLPPGEARADWAIFTEVGRRLGFAEYFPFATSAEVYQEFVQLTQGRVCDMSGLTHEILAEFGPQQWPYPIGSHPTQEAKRLYTDFKFPTPDQKARFVPFHSQGLAEPLDPEYPFVLTTGRLYGHWHTLTRTGRIEKIQQMHPDPFLEIHPRDAQKLQIQDNTWVEVRSRRGSARFPAKVTAAIAPGTLFVPMHWGSLWADQAEANALTHPHACPTSFQPELKACAVALTSLDMVN